MARLKPTASNIIFVLVFLSLLLSLFFVIHQLVTAPVNSPDITEKEKSDYVLMILQCFVGLVVLFLPSVLEHRLHIDVPDAISTMFFIFLFAAIYLGEVRSFYYKIPHWDVILHAFSGLMVGALGFSLVSLLNQGKVAAMQLSPGFIALVAFMFSCTIGVLWEVYEFSMDALLGTNMQKFALESGELLEGRAALLDTMKDLIVDALGALVMSVAGYISLKTGGNFLDKMALKKVDDTADDK